MARGSHTLTRITNTTYLSRFFRAKARRFRLPKLPLESIRILEIGRERFKRALKYTLRFRQQGSAPIERTIRGNVPSRHRLEELRVADATLRLLHHHRFDHGSIQVPRPLGYDRSLRLFLYESSPGRSLSSVLPAVSRTRQLLYIKESAKALSRLHRLRLRGPIHWTKRRIQDDLGYFRQDFLRTKLPWIRSKLPLLDALESRMVQAWDKRRKAFRLVHGDFTPYNILIRSGGLTIIDFGNALQADPLLDLASFVSQLELIGDRGKLPVIRTQELNTVFITAYDRGFWEPRNTLEQKSYQSYRAWWLIQAAAYLVSTQPIQKNTALLRSIFQKAQQLLDS